MYSLYARDVESFIDNNRLILKWAVLVGARKRSYRARDVKVNLLEISRTRRICRNCRLLGKHADKMHAGATLIDRWERVSARLSRTRFSTHAYIRVSYLSAFVFFFSFFSLPLPRAFFSLSSLSQYVSFAAERKSFPCGGIFTIQLWRASMICTIRI